jgi:hypothetical protein
LGNTQVGGVRSGIHIPQIAGFARFFQTFFDFSNNLLEIALQQTPDDRLEELYTRATTRFQEWIVQGLFAEICL